MNTFLCVLSLITLTASQGPLVTRPLTEEEATCLVDLSAERTSDVIDAGRTPQDIQMISESDVSCCINL